MYDSSTSARFNKPLTGHTIGSVSLVMHTGNDSAEILEAVKDYDKVLFIPALHYLNIPNPAQGIFTGSSRFNAVLIEKGKIIGPIFSSRVTDSFSNVFSNITRISSQSNSVNLSNTYGRRMPVAYSVPEYLVAEKVKITDSADSF
jgi:predicted Zn-dependent protease